MCIGTDGAALTGCIMMDTKQKKQCVVAQNNVMADWLAAMQNSMIMSQLKQKQKITAISAFVPKVSFW